MNYYQHHIGDFNNATRHLDRLERAIYREMLDLYYDTEAPLTLDFKKLCHKLCARREGEPEIVQAILDEFFTKTDDGWVHQRCERELTEYRKRVEQSMKAGKASAERRLNRRSTPVEPPLNDRSTTVQPTNNHKPITINHEPIISPAPNGAEASPRESLPNLDDLPDGLSYHDALFQIAVPWLVANGVKDSSARSLLGGARKQLGAEGAWLLASECMEQKPIEPASWLAASLNARIARPKGTKYESEKDRSRREAYEALTGRRNGDALTIDI